MTEITGRLQSVLVGSLLGDGRLSRSGKSARFIENHSDGQRSYLDWKVREWGCLVRAGVKPVTWKRAGKQYPGWRFETVSRPELIPWHGLFYEPTGPKKVRAETVSFVDSLALAIWFMDDGTAAWWPQITFGMPGDSRANALQILENLGFRPRWQPRTETTGNFIFEGEEQALRFLSTIEPHVPDCMKYKLQCGFQGRGFQIRQTAPEDLLRGLARDGMPIRRMADELGLSASVVSRRLVKLGIPHPRKTGRPKDL